MYYENVDEKFRLNLFCNFILWTVLNLMDKRPFESCVGKGPGRKHNIQWHFIFACHQWPQPQSHPGNNRRPERLG